MKTQNGYTKGPWFWDDAVPTEYNEEFYIDNAPWLTNGEPVGGQIVTGQICVQNPANLALIAAAPELLEALKELISEGAFPTTSFEKAKAAIAKAEGE